MIKQSHYWAYIQRKMYTHTHTHTHTHAHTHTLEYYSVIKKNEIMPFAATQMDLEMIILNEVRKRKKNTIWYHLYVESKNTRQINIPIKQK